MKKMVLLVGVLLCCSVVGRSQTPAATGRTAKDLSSQGPFGFQAGMTRAEVIKILGKDAIIKDNDDEILFSKAPKPSSFFGAYFCYFDQNSKLVSVDALGNKTRSSSTGDELRTDFDYLKHEIEGKYGKATITMDNTVYGTHPREDDTWMASLARLDRYLEAHWGKSDVHNDQSHIIRIVLSAHALDENTGHIDISYEFDGFAESQRAADNSLKGVL